MAHRMQNLKKDGDIIFLSSCKERPGFSHDSTCGKRRDGLHNSLKDLFVEQIASVFGSLNWWLKSPQNYVPVRLKTASSGRKVPD
jgi:hypothetical protein